VQAVSWEFFREQREVFLAVKRFTRFLDLAAGILIIAAFYFFILFCWRLVEKKLPRYFTAGYFIVYLLSVLLLGLVLPGMADLKLPVPPGSLMGLATICVAIIPALRLLNKKTSKSWRGTVKTLLVSYFFLLGFYFMLSFFMKLHESIVYLYFGFHFVINLYPLVYLEKRMAKGDLLPVSVAGDRDVLEGILTEYGLSAREREVVEMVLAGKTNREIEAELFISINTVKNHISNVYRKFGVKNRIQLTNLLGSLKKSKK